MNYSIVGRHIDLDRDIRSYIEKSIEGLTKYQLDLISIKVILSSDEKKKYKRVAVELIINIAHKNSIVIKQKEKELFNAIDSAFSKADSVLRKEHEKMKSHRKEGLKETTYKYITANDEEKEVEDEIIPQELELYKPMEVAEALERLKEGDKQFYVFYDHDEKMRVIYKISDNKYGLY